MATPKHKKNFPMFEELAAMIPEECHKDVRQTMLLLENVWRDDLCTATIMWLKKGKRKEYKKSRVMRKFFSRIIAIIESGESQITVKQ